MDNIDEIVKNLDTTIDTLKEVLALLKEANKEMEDVIEQNNTMPNNRYMATTLERPSGNGSKI